MSVVYHIPQAYVNSPVKTFKPSPEQAAAIRRYGIRVTALDGTKRLVTRACKCGRIQEAEIDTEDTERNRWEARAAIDRLSGDDWRCTFCAMPSLITYRAKGASASGGNGGSRGRSHRNRQSKAGDARVSKRQIKARIKQLADMIANPGQTPDEVIAGWQREQEALVAVLVSYSRKKVA